MTKVLIANLDVVYFFYGFAFAALGFMVFAQIRAVEKSEFKLLGILWLLGSFGLTHAIREFSLMFAIIKGELPWLVSLGLAALVVSYLFLLLFGYRLINIGDKKRLGLWFPGLLAALFLGLPIYAGAASPTVWNISGRYFLGFPGAILSAIGLLLYLDSESVSLGAAAAKKSMIVCAGSFCVYGVLAGLVVPEAGFLPASLINNASFISTFGMPAQIFRAVAAIGIAWSMWHVVNIFNFEQQAHARQAQQDLRQAHGQLERRVEARTAELAESETKFRGLVETTSDWIWEVDENAVYTYASPQVRDLLGFEPAEVIGKTPFDFMAEDEATRVAGIFGPIAETREHFKLLENTVLHKDGHPVVLETSGAPIFDVKGEWRGYRGIDRDITERKETKELSDALNSINMTITSTLDVDLIMGQVVGEAGKAVGSEAAGILLLEDEQWVVRYLYGFSRELLGTPFSEEGAEGPMLAAKTGRPVVSNDAYNDPRLNRQVMERYQIRSMMAVALTAREEVIGALYFSNHTAAAHFTGAQVDFAAKLSASLTLALENARLFREERDIADTLQEALITVPKRLPGIDFGYLYRSATETAEVGGDFYDLFELENDRIAVVVGDVSGKGVGAATLTSLVKNVIKAYAFEEDSPAVIMAKTNELIQKSSGPTIFVTLFLGIIDTGDGAISYCNAGHPPPIIRRKTGETSRLDVGSPAIGILSGFTYLPGTDTLGPGDALVLYTDGVTEVRCAGELYGEERLIACVKKLGSAAISDVPQLIYNELTDSCGCVLADDLALVAISRQPLID